MNFFSEIEMIGKNIDSADYHRQVGGVKRGDAAYVMSRSEIMAFAACPQRWLDGYESKETDSTDWGSLMDTLIIQPESFDRKYAVTPEYYLSTPRPKSAAPEQKPWNARANFCSEWEESQSGKIVIKHKEHEKAKVARARLFKDQALADFIAASDKSVYLIGNYCDRETSVMVPVKILIDLLPQNGTAFDRSLGDLKTTVSAMRRAWKNSCYNFHYDAQAALYLDLYNELTGEGRTDFCHLIQESVFPYQTAKRIFENDFLEIGRLKYRNALKAYCQSLATGVWPDYDTNAPGLNGWSLIQPEAYMLEGLNH